MHGFRVSPGSGVSAALNTPSSPLKYGLDGPAGVPVISIKYRSHLVRGRTARRPRSARGRPVKTQNVLGSDRE